MDCFALDQVASDSSVIHSQSSLLDSKERPDHCSQQNSLFRMAEDTSSKIITYIGGINKGIHFSLTGTRITLTIDENSV